MYMMITGCEVIHSEPGAENSIFKITLTPLTNVKQDVDFGTSGGISGMISAVKKQAINPISTMHISMKEWIDRGYKIGRHVTLELLPDDTTGGIK